MYHPENHLLTVSTFNKKWLGGGNSNIFFFSPPKPWGFMIQFDGQVYFLGPGLKLNHQRVSCLRHDPSLDTLTQCRGRRTFRAFDTSRHGVLDVTELIEGFRSEK